MISIARELLFHDKLRFLITVVGLSFTIVMIVYDVGMFFGVTEDSVVLVDRAGTELWLSQKGAGRFNAPSRLPAVILKKVRRLHGVIQACAIDFAQASLKNVATSQVILIGIDPDCPFFQPWEINSGSLAEIKRKDALVIDDLALKGSLETRPGDTVKINDYEVRIVAITHNNKSFSSPFTYTNIETFEKLTGQAGEYNFIALKISPGTDGNHIAAQLDGDGSKLVATPVQDFRQATISGLIAEGVGMIFVVVLVGVMVGMLIITMTMYTGTMQQLRDFAILKALGATNRKIWGIVLEEALLQTVASFVLGLGASLGVNAFIENGSGISGRFPPEAVLACFGLMLVLSVLGSLLSISKATHADPIMVFRA